LQNICCSWGKMKMSTENNDIVSVTDNEYNSNYLELFETWLYQNLGYSRGQSVYDIYVIQRNISYNQNSYFMVVVGVLKYTLCKRAVFGMLSTALLCCCCIWCCIWVELYTAMQYAVSSVQLSSDKIAFAPAWNGWPRNVWRWIISDGCILPHFETLMKKNKIKNDFFARKQSQFSSD